MYAVDPEPRHRWPLVPLALVLCTAAACERVEITAVNSGAPLVEADPSVAALHLRPAWFGATEGLTEEAAAGLQLQWQASMVIGHMLDDGTEVLVPDLSAPLALESLAVTPGEGVLAVDALYASAPMRVSLRFKQTAGDTFCRVDLDLGPRTLAFDISPTVREGIPTWSTQLRSGLTAAEPLTWTAVETCPIDLQRVDWAYVDSRIDADLTAQASSEFVPAVRDQLVEALALPRAGLQVLPLETGFYAPTATTIATRVAAAPPWVGSGVEIDASDGLRVAVDAHLDSSLAPCAGALELRPAAATARALQPHGTPGVTPAAGAPYAAALVLDQGFADLLLHRLAATGHLCADLEVPRLGGLPGLGVLIEGIGAASGFDFGQRGRVRVQPRGSVSIARVDPATVRLTLDAMRLEIYGEESPEDDDDGVLVRVALLEGRYVIEGKPGTDASGALVLSELSVDVELTEGDTSLLEGIGITVDAETLAATLAATLVERVLAVPLPQPFGRPLEVVEIDARDDALWVYFGL